MGMQDSTCACCGDMSSNSQSLQSATKSDIRIWARLGFLEKTQRELFVMRLSKIMVVVLVLLSLSGCFRYNFVRLTKNTLKCSDKPIKMSSPRCNLHCSSYHWRATCGVSKYDCMLLRK